MKTACEHGTPTDEDCAQCRAIVFPQDAKDREIERLKNIIQGCPVCSELERNIKP